MDDLISRQAAIDAVSRGCWEFRGIFAECEKNLNELPSAQPEHDDAEFWRKRSDEYEKMFLDLCWRTMNGVKFESMQIDKNGITLKMKELSQEDNA